MIIFHIIWAFGLYIMWLRAYITMKKRGREHEHVAGEHKAVFELAAAMQKQICDLANEEASDVSASTEAQLRQRITKDLRGGSISYTAPLLPNGEGDQARIIKSWVWAHKLSIAAVVVCVLATHFSANFLPPTIMFLLPLPVELMIALYIGSTRESRVVLFIWIYMITTVPTQIVLLIFQSRI